MDRSATAATAAAAGVHDGCGSRWGWAAAAVRVAGDAGRDLMMANRPKHVIPRTQCKNSESKKEWLWRLTIAATLSNVNTAAAGVDGQQQQ